MGAVSIDEIPDGLPLTAAQRDALEARWQAFEKSPDEGELWDDVKRALLRE